MNPWAASCDPPSAAPSPEPKMSRSEQVNDLLSVPTLNTRLLLCACKEAT